MLQSTVAPPLKLYTRNFYQRTSSSWHRFAVILFSYFAAFIFITNSLHAQGSYPLPVAPLFVISTLSKSNSNCQTQHSRTILGISQTIIVDHQPLQCHKGHCLYILLLNFYDGPSMMAIKGRLPFPPPLGIWNFKSSGFYSEQIMFSYQKVPSATVRIIHILGGWEIVTAGPTSSIAFLLPPNTDGLHVVERAGE